MMLSRAELAKMAVDDSAKGKGIGYLLGQRCVDKARELNFRQVFLESNTKLKPASKFIQEARFQAHRRRAVSL